jgi:SPP1 gp7 family putative phage head morphogenesis protein
MTQTAADLGGVDQAAARAEPATAIALRNWFLALVAAVSIPQLTTSLRTGSTASVDAVLRAVPLPQLPLQAPALKEARRVLKLLVAGAPPDRIVLGLNMLDAGVARAVDRHGAQLIREVDAATRRAVGETIKDAYLRGLHPYDVSPVIRQTVGLTSRQARSVVTHTQALLEDGVHPAIAEARAKVMADRLRTQRARLITRTETIRALNDARLAAYQQAQLHGLVDGAAELVWVASPDACPVCSALDGTTSPVMAGFAEGPPAHPACRCTIDLQPG